MNMCNANKEQDKWCAGGLKQKRERRLSPAHGSADRIVIGESTQAGWPISAKVYQSDGKGDFGMPPMRWVKRADSTFALECYVFGQSQWVEVPLWDTPPNAPSLHPVVQPTRPWTHKQESEEMLRDTGRPEIRACVECGENAPETGHICDECREQNSLL